MDIIIRITIAELKERGLLAAYCELFREQADNLKDGDRVQLSEPQAAKIGLTWIDKPVKKPTRRKAK